MTVKEVLEEDGRRMAALREGYDPLKGSDPAKIDWGRCKTDFEYWAARCCYIKNKRGGGDIPFILNRPQRKLVRELEKMRTNYKPIRLILLKARQWGGSTCSQLYMAWMQMVLKDGLNSLIVAHQHSTTAEIRDMFMRMLKEYPGEEHSAQGEEHSAQGTVHKPKKLTENVGPGMFRVPMGNFKVKVGSAERPDSCRGGDYSLIHCSEVAIWKKTRLKTPEDMLKAACSGVLLEPMTMILLESTANGTGNFFHIEYEAAKNGKSQFTPLFIAWFEIEQYSMPFEEGGKERFAEMLLKGKDNPEAEDERSQPGCYLWWLWEKGATLEAIHWYVNERAKYSDHGQMASEYPSDDIEAFVHSGARVFDRYKVEALRISCMQERKRGEITGEKPSGPFSLQNLKFMEDTQGSLKVWKLPQEEEPGIKITERYLTVVDIGGRSMKADWSVIVVFDRKPMLNGEGPEITAQWRGHTDFDLLAWNAARIAKFYHDSLLVIESNTLETRDRERLVEGDQSNFLLNQLREVYPNLYARKRKPEDIK